MIHVKGCFVFSSSFIVSSFIWGLTPFWVYICMWFIFYGCTYTKKLVCSNFIYFHVGVQFSSVQSLSRIWLFATPWTAACQASLSITNSRRLHKLMSIKPVMPSNHLIHCCPLLLLPYIFPNIRVFSKESVLHIRWLKYWNFSFSISPSDQYSGLISFMMDWLAPWSTKDAQEFSPTPQELVLSFLYGPILISIYDSWKNHSFD